jgi:hypothetical protein
MQVNAAHTATRRAVVLNFYHSPSAYAADRRVFKSDALRPAALAVVEDVPVDARRHDELAGLPGVRSFPPALITERGMTLNGLARATGNPDFIAALQALLVCVRCAACSLCLFCCAVNFSVICCWCCPIACARYAHKCTTSQRSHTGARPAAHACRRCRS